MFKDMVIVSGVMHEMKKRNLRKGLASMDVDGGMGMAMILER